MENELIAFLGILFACVLRTLYPFLKKLADGEITQFEMKYLLSMVASVVISAIAAILLFPTFIIPSGVTWLQVFIVSFMFAWFSNDVINIFMPKKKK